MSDSIQCSRCFREEPSEPLDFDAPPWNAFDPEGLEGWMQTPLGWTRYVFHGVQEIVCDYCLTSSANEADHIVKGLGHD